MESPDERYRIERELGRGGMGQVFLAQDLKAGGRHVALKLLTPSTGPAAEARLRRFRREGDALARFRHPHVVAIHAVGEARGRAFLVLDYVEGENLEDRLERDGPFPSCEAAELLRDLADAMATVHAEGILHRDLKPANVLLRARDGVALLTDFGLAVDLASDATRLTQDGCFLGTPGFMSPEQASGRTDQVGPATDVYGLGALLYCVLTGRPPLVAEDLIQALVQVMEVTPEPPSRWVPGVDRALDRICARCLAKDPGDRFPDAASLRTALDDYLSGRGSGAGRGWALAGAGLTALLVVGAGVALAPWSEPPPTLPQATSPSQAPTRDARKEQRRARFKEANVLAEEGVEHSRAGRFREAVESYTESIRLREYSITYHNRSNAKQSLGDLKGALADLNRSIELKPRSGNLAERGVLLCRLSRLTKSFSDFTRSLEIKEDPYVLFQRGETYRRTGRPLLAFADARRLREIAPRLPLGFVLEARILELQRKPAEALVPALAAAKLAPDDVRVLESLARLYLDLGRWQECVERANQVLARRPEGGSAYRLRGIGRLRLGDMGGRADLERFLELSPNSLRAEAIRQDLKNMAKRKE